MNLIAKIAQVAKPYITISGFTGETYTYAVRTKNVAHPVIDHVMHEAKASAGQMIYFAVPGTADLQSLNPEEKLYIGSQGNTDRMFRGDNMGGKNFHHLQMRDGNRKLNLISYLRTGGCLTIYRAASSDLYRMISEDTLLKAMLPLADGRIKLSRGRDHIGYWLEQLALRDDLTEWQWNSRGAQAEAVAILKQLGL